MFPRTFVVGAILSLTLLPPVGAEPAPPTPLREHGIGTARFPRFIGVLNAETAVKVGLQQSLSVALSRTQLRQEAANVAEAQSASRPQISVSGFAMRNSMPMIYQTAPGIMPAFLQSYPNPGALSANAALMFPLFTGGALENQLQAAEEGQKAAVARTAFALRESARLIRATYFQVQQTRSDLATLRWQLTQTREMERIAHEQLVVGKVAPYVRLRAQSEVAANQQKINDTSAELDRREADLKNAMGVAMDSDFKYPEEEFPPAPPPALSDLLATALSDRSDLVAARYQAEQGDRLLSAALSEYSPKAYLVGMGETMRVSSTVGDTGYSVGLVISLPIFDGGMRGAREDRARASLEERRVRVRQMELETCAQVVTSRSQLVASLLNLDLSQVELDKANEEWRIATLRQKTGRSIYVETLDAMTALARARVNRSRAIFTARSAEADLLYATGRY